VRDDEGFVKFATANARRLRHGDTDTPAGIDMTAVRSRADRIRRRRVALATAAAAATAVAVAVPVAVLRSGTDPGTPAASGRPVALACPDAVPEVPANAGPGLDRALVPFAADRALVCTYGAGGASTGGLTGVVRLTAAETRSAIDRLDAAEPVTGDQVCTSEFGYPFLLQVGGAERVVTLRLEPYGCARVTNGAWGRGLGRDEELLRSLSDRAAKSTACAERVDVPPAVPTGGEPPGDTFLPTDARRLLVCRYGPHGERVPAGKAWWNAVLSPAETVRTVAELNAAPAFHPGSTGCRRDAGPLLTLFAVSADGVVPAAADGGGCEVVDNGAQQVQAKALVGRLAGG
jgi:hypothetical protein